MSDKVPTPKDLARLARLGIESSRALRVFHEEMLQFDGSVSSLRCAVRRAAEDIQSESLNVPGIRIAVFPIDDEGGAK